MKHNFQNLATDQMDRRLARLRTSDLREIPPKGWIRALRDALGMSATQLARRLGAAQPNVAEWEKREVNGTITFTTLRKIAHALDCDLVYALVPRKPLREMAKDRALAVATRNVDRVGHSMNLEGQGTSESRRRELIAQEAQRLLTEKPGQLWDE